MRRAPITVELLLLGLLLKKAGYRSAGAHLSVVKNQHILLGFPWLDALDLEMREGKRACERGIGPPQKCGAFDMKKLADLTIASDPLCPEGGNVAARRHFMRLLVGDARGRAAHRSVHAGHVLGWPRLWTLCVRFAGDQSRPSSWARSVRTHVPVQPSPAVRLCVQSRWR